MTPPAGPGAPSPRRGPATANRREPRRGGTASGARACSRVRMWAPLASRGLAPICWTRWTRGAGARRAGPDLRTAAAGFTARRRRRGPPAASAGLPPAHDAYTVAALAARLPASAGARRQGAAGPQGPRLYACVRQRVTLAQDALPARPVGLGLKRGPDPPSPDESRQAPGRTSWHTCGGSVGCGGPSSHGVRQGKRPWG